MPFPMPPVVDLLVNRFVPARAIEGRTEAELARTFVFTHIFGPLIAQPMWLYLLWASPRVDYPIVVLAVAICGFWALPLLLRRTGSIEFAAIFSFQMLAASSLFGAYHYGGFASPFLPWAIVSLMLGLFYLARHRTRVLALFSANLAVFFGFAWFAGLPERVPLAELRVLGWLSIASATVYMTWMALYYARIIGLRSELEKEIERQHATALELQRARTVAEETSRARARFFSKMSHELRTPLNAIIGYSDILLEDCTGGGADSARRSADIARVNAAGRHLLSLVSDVLDADKIGQDDLEVEVRPEALGALVADVEATAKPMVEQNGNAFVVVCPNRAYVLRTDARKLRQILLNLLSNAGKFTRHGTVRLEFLIDFHPHEHQLVVTVSDTGIGISPEALPRLFTHYEQADATVFNRYGGTGIGLALSRKLAMLLGGDIAVSSRPGHGTRFTVTVPAQMQTGSERTARGTDETADRERAALATTG